MEEVHLIDYTLYIAAFLIGTTLLQMFSKKTSLPYTVVLLTVGFLSQSINHFFNLGIHISLSSDFVYFILLPILLFEAAMRINIHQFKIQFRTITFLATFCLMLSIFIIAFCLLFLIGIPFEIALLFGTIIAATDPIAVLALFKTLGAPKRLALIAEGESMFNDATGVIAFRLVSGFVVGQQMFTSQTIFNFFGNFLYVFFGSMIAGIILGYFCSVLLKKVKNDKILIGAIITALALGSFSVAEHFLHVSGVVTTVISGIVFGNLARGRIESVVTHFLEEYFEYIGFISLSLIFFFASFTLDIGLFTRELQLLFIVIFIVLLARAISIYVTIFLSNHLPFFKSEPNIPLAWQHILNWGGLRGIIPLVLVYSLPDSFIYKELMLQFTFATLLFTLFVNGLTIKRLLIFLKLHIPAREEKIVQDEMRIFALDEAQQKLKKLSQREFSPSIIYALMEGVLSEKNKFKRELLDLSTPKEFLKSLKLQSIEIERKTLRDLFEQGRFTEGVLYEFESELDLQQDLLEYPYLYNKDEVFNEKGEIVIKKPFRKRLSLLRRFIARHKFLSNLLHIDEKDIIFERYALLRARLITSYAVLEYLNHLRRLFNEHTELLKAITTTRATQKKYIIRNKKQVKLLSKDYPNVIISYQEKIIRQLVLSNGKAQII